MRPLEKIFKTYREQTGMFIPDLCKKIGISTPTYYNIIKGDTLPSPKVMEKIHAFLDKIGVETEEEIKNNPVTPVKKDPIPENHPQAEIIKVQITSASDFIDYLMQGKTIYQTNSEYSYSLYNGAIIKYRNNQPCFINPAIDTSQAYTVNVPKPIVMKLGSSYLLNNNETGFCFQAQDKTYSVAVKGYGVFTLNTDGTCEENMFFTAVKEL